MRKIFFRIILLVIFSVLIHPFLESTTGRWILKSTKFIPANGKKNFSDNDVRRTYSVSENSASLIQHVRKIGNIRSFNVRFKWEFSKPPAVIIPDKVYKLSIIGTSSGYNYSNEGYGIGGIGGIFNFGNINGWLTEAQRSGGGSRNVSVNLSKKNPSQTKYFTLMAPSRYNGTVRVKFKAGFGRKCQVIWEYEFRTGEVEEEERNPPTINSIKVKQKNISRKEAELWIRADIKYGKTFTPGSGGDVIIDFRIGSSILTLKPYQPGFSFSGSHVIASGKLRTKNYGDMILSVNLIDKRIRNITNRMLHFQDTQKKRIYIARPSAEILGIKGYISVCRVNQITRDKGVNFKRGQTAERQVVNEDFEEINSKWLYSGDKVSLIGKPPSSISLEWKGGVRGKAFCSQGLYRGYLKSGVFTVGLSRGFSGEITNRWKRTWGESFQVLFTMGVNKSRDTVRDKSIQWILKKIPWIGSRLAGFVGNLGVFSWHAGDTVYSDISYINLKSLVHIKPGRNGQLAISTLSGNPDFYYNSGRSKVSIPAGKRVVRSSGGVVKKENFDPLKLDRWWERIKYTNWKNQKKRKNKSGYDISSLQANVKSLKFYEGNNYMVPYKQRRYITRFSRSSTRYIWGELNLKYRLPKKKIYFNMETVWRRDDGSVITRQTSRFYISPTDPTQAYSQGFGSNKYSNWNPGKYSVDIIINGKIVAKGSFEVTNK